MAIAALPPGITRRGTKFRVSIMVNGIRRTATEPTLAQAISTADYLRGQIKAHGEEARGEWNLGEAGKHYEEDHLVPSGAKPGTLVTFRYRMNNLLRYFGADCNLRDITHARLVAYMKHRKETDGVHLNTISQELQLVSYLFSKTRTLGGHTAPNPQLPAIRVTKGRMRYVTDLEETALLDYFAHTSRAHMRDAIVCLIDTGLRVRVEFLAMTWQDVDLKARRVHVWNGKSKTPRSVPMTSRVHEILSRRRLTNGSDRGPFTGLPYVHLLKAFVEFRVHAGLEDDHQFTLHVLRHTFCTRLVKAGVDLNTVKTLAGHENIQTTMEYVQFVPTAAVSAIEAMERDRGADPAGKLVAIQGGKS